MAVTVYKCSVCNRTIELERDKRSLEVIHNCVITQNCRGYLFVQENLEDYIRGKNPESVRGLTDWNQRRILFDFVQSVENTSWLIRHDMKSFPSVFTHVKSPTEEDPNRIIQLEPTDITIVDENTIVLTFDRPYAGTAQLITNTSFPGNSTFEQPAASDPAIQLTHGEELTIGVRRQATHTTFIILEATWLFPSGIKSNVIYAVDDVQSVLSPWRSYQKVEIAGVEYELRSFPVKIAAAIAGSYLTINKAGPVYVNKPDQVIVMISQPPYQIFDTEKTRVLDLFDVVSDPNSMIFDGVELYVQESKLKNVFPLIVGL